MHLLSKSGEELISDCSNNPDFAIDTLIVGSGYGGAVAALRLAEHGTQVVVIERGDEYVSGEFPNDMSQLGKHVRADILTPNGVTSQGYESALFDIKVGAGIGAVVGNGLGGGSLINAGIGLEPDPKVFQQQTWPAALRDENLDEHFKLAKETLELQIPGKPEKKPHAYDPTKTKKYQRLEDIYTQAIENRSAEDNKVDITFETLPMAVQLEENPSQALGKRAVCNGCGDCITGCNFNAKLSLTSTYLPKAVTKGTKIFTGLTVQYVKQNLDPKTNKIHPWEVTFVRTSERELSRSIMLSKGELKDSDNVRNPDNWQYIIKAKRVILSAGTFGSTEILLRSRAQGLKVSGTALGLGFSGNGDDVSFAFDLDDEANAIGSGAAKNPDNPAHTTPPAYPESSVGPTASGVIKFIDKDDIKRSSIIEDGAIPGLMRKLFGELTHTLGAVAQLNEFKFRNHNGVDHLAVNPITNNHTLTMLGMGHDSANGIIALDTISDRIGLAWPKVNEELSPKIHQMRQKVVEKLGAIFIKNPAAGILPDAVSSVLNGPTRNTNMITVHPLGGCRMADNVYTGVVNHWGAVFNDDGTSPNKLHQDLYVLDGSIIPSSVGVNPLLTITALAERACKMICLENIQSNPAPQSFDLKSLNDKEQPKPFYDEKLEKSTATTILSEVLRANKVKIAVELARQLELTEQKICLPVALFLEMQIDDWDKLLENPKHLATVIPTNNAEGRFTRSRLVFDIKEWPIKGRDNELDFGKSVEFDVISGQVHLYVERSNFILKALRLTRVMITYLLARLWPELIKTRKLKIKKSGSLFCKIWNGSKLLWHASEMREFHYQLILVDDKSRQYELTGKKSIEYAAGYIDLFIAIIKLLFTWKFPSIKRKSAWEQLTQLNIELKDHSTKQVLFKNRFDMDIPEIMRRFIPQLGVQKDTLNALFSLAGYPLLILRGIIKTRMLDFRLPDYLDDRDADKKNNKPLPYSDPAVIIKPPKYSQFKKLPEKYKFPLHPILKVEPKNYPFEVIFKSGSEEKIEIGLFRYKQDTTAKESLDGLYKTKSIVLLNGLALTTHAFVAEELGSNNLATMLLDQGWDVWLLEYRASPMLSASAKYSSLDDIAAFDIPEAIQQVIGIVSQEQNAINTMVNATNLQVYCFSHCVGSAALMMSILSGKLRHTNGESKLAGILISQFQPYLVGSETTQMRLQLAAFMRNVLNLNMLNFTAGQAKADGLHAFMDRVFSSFNYSKGNTFSNEQCDHDKNLAHHQPESTSCKRMTGIFGRSMVHDNLHPETHEKLDLYFGRANVGTFLHGAKCVEYERLVNMDGQNVYVNDENIRDYLDMPVMLLHGGKNVLFNKESFFVSKERLENIFGAARKQRNLDQYLLAERYAHFDCTIGKNAHKDIFEPVIKFFNKAHQNNLDCVPNTCYTYHPRMPLVGPIVGWVRQENGKVKIRVWGEIDNSGSGIHNKTVAITKTTVGTKVTRQIWRVHQQAVRSRADTGEININETKVARIAFAVAEIDIPISDLPDDINEIKIEMMSLHEMLRHADSKWPQPAFTTLIHDCGGLANRDFARLDLHEINNIVLNFKLTDADKSDIDGLFSGIEDILKSFTYRANAAKPNTFSRRVRDIKLAERCCVSMKKVQLLNQPDQLTFFAAGCRHPGLTGYEETRSDFTLKKLSKTIEIDKPKFMLMLGDQIYSDARAGLFDESTLIERLIPRYRKAFDSAGFREVSRQLPLYMVMDDHEIIDNWSKEHQYKGDFDHVLAKNARSAFFVYQYSHGPKKLLPKSFDYAFSHNGFNFLTLDTRSKKTRVPNTKILDDGQWQVLEQWLLVQNNEQNKDQPKFILTGSVIFPGLIENDCASAPRQADTWQMSTKERIRILEFIAKNNIYNVVFVSSDYHCTAVSEITFANNLKAYSVIAPSLHAPLRFANVEPSHILKKEEISSENNLIATILTESWKGEGWLKLDVDTQVKNNPKIELCFALKDFNDDNFHQFKWDLLNHQKL